MLKKIYGSAILSILMCFFPSQPTNSCGYSNFDNQHYSFLNENIIEEDNKVYRSFIRFEQIYDAAYAKKDSAYQERLRDENLWEWHHKFCSYADIADVRSIVYKSSIEELISLQTAVHSEEMRLDSRLAENEFAEQLRNNHCTETIDYLVFAKKCEPHVIAKDPWIEKPQDIAMMRNLMNEGKSNFTKVKSHFIKLRYAFQTMRLAHYQGNYQETINLYNYFVPKLSEYFSVTNNKQAFSVVTYWIIGLKAGALKHLGQYPESSYLFSLVFNGCISKRDAAAKSFSIQTDEQFQQATLMCRNYDEKITLYAMRGYAYHAKALEEMQLIYDINPRSEYLDALLVKEIKRLEKTLLGSSFNDRDGTDNATRKNAGEYAIRLNHFVVKCIKAQRVKNIELWLVADGYLELIRGDYYAALKTFDRNKEKIKSKTILEQIEILELVAKAHSIDKLEADTEQKVTEIIEHPLYKKYPDLPDFLFDRLADMYRQAGSEGLAFRCHHDLVALKPNPQLHIINDLLSLAQKSNKNALERQLVTDSRGEALEDQLWEIKGVTLLAENKFEAALECFKKVSTARLDASKFNPFESRTNDCVNCKLRDSSRLLTRREITEQLIDLQYESKADLENTAKHLYRLGVAHYNMSYYGHAWGVKDFYRSGLSWHSADRHYSDTYTGHYYPYGNKEYTDLSVALFYFERAYEASKSKDTELAARCAFWAARCQQKEYYAGNDFRQTAYGRIPALPSEYTQYLGLFKKGYSDTKFYQEVIKECIYFQRYAGK